MEGFIQTGDVPHAADWCLDADPRSVLNAEFSRSVRVKLDHRVGIFLAEPRHLLTVLVKAFDHPPAGCQHQWIVGGPACKDFRFLVDGQGRVVEFGQDGRA